MSFNEQWFMQFYQDLIEFMAEPKQPFEKWGKQLEQQLHDFYVANPHGDMDRWMDAFENLPHIDHVQADLNTGPLTFSNENLSEEQSAQLLSGLKGLMPWRKGPFQFFDTFIDTEWRSDWKWDRIKDHIAPLHGRTILDVGCGSGYHMWRMLGAGAQRVVGVDPSKLFFWQFETAKKYYKQAMGVETAPIHFLPFKMEDVPSPLKSFDTVFSMGVLYHRRSPLDHLSELFNALRPGGEVVLETLVIEGELGEALMPEDRYAMMRNVWFLPSTETLSLWLRRVGFKDVKVVEQNTTTLEEQRTTEWMQYNSLKDFLDTNDTTKTAEGYPAPLRATLVASRPF